MKKLLSAMLSAVIIITAISFPFTAQAAGIARVKGVKAVSTTASSVKLKWKKVKGATGYQVYYSLKKKSGYKKGKAVKKAKTVRATVKGLKANKKYYFKVRAVKKKKKGKFSKVISAKTKAVSSNAAKGAITQKPVLLESGKLYTAYDLTGNGKTDTVKYIRIEPDSTHAAIAELYINNQKVYTEEILSKGVSFQLFAPSGNNCYIIYSTYATGAHNYDTFYKYKNGKLTNVSGNLFSVFPLTGIGEYTRKDNTHFSAVISLGPHDRDIFKYNDDLSSEANVAFRYNYKIDGEKISFESEYGNAVSPIVYTAYQDFSACSSPTDTNAEYTIYEGDTVKITQMYYTVVTKYMYDGEPYAAPQTVFKAEVTREYGSETINCWINMDYTGVEISYDNPLLYEK